MTDPTSPAPSTSSVSAAELAEIRESITTLHRTDADGFCNWCGDTYPCAMAVVMHALDAAEHALDASRAEAAALRDLLVTWAEACDDWDAYMRAIAGGEIASPATYQAEEERLSRKIEEAEMALEMRARPALFAAAPTPGADGGAT
jgi:hypothetical protein